MATHLDLEEQEQLDQLKAFWDRHGNLITAALLIAVTAYFAWFGWNAWQRSQGEKAGSMYDELDRAAQVGDAAVTGKIFEQMKERYPRAAFTEQAGLLAAKVALDKGQPDAARAHLTWVAESAIEREYRSVARLRLAGLLLDEKKYELALKQLDGVDAAEFAPLADDRRGDILLAQGKPEQARAAYQKAWQAFDPKVDYRRFVEAKLNVLGAQPGASALPAAPVMPAPSVAPAAPAAPAASAAASAVPSAPPAPAASATSAAR